MKNNQLEHIEDEIHLPMMNTLKIKQKKTPSFVWLIVASFFLGFLFIACRTIKDRDLYSTTQNKELLPLLEPRVDVMSFQQAYAMHTLLRQKNTYEFSSTITIDSALFLSSMMFNQRIIDHLLTFEHEVNHNITDTTRNKKGYIVCHIKNGTVDPGNYALAIISGITLFIPNLFGMPLGKVDTKLEVEVAIYNLSEERIASYQAEGNGRAWLALYYGYSERGQLPSETPYYRMSAIRAFQSALDTIKEQLEKDAGEISWRLRQ